MEFTWTFTCIYLDILDIYLLSLYTILLVKFLSHWQQCIANFSTTPI